jgi:hypothetical protein
MASLTPDVIHPGRDDTHWMYRRFRPAFVDRLAVGKETFVEAWERWQILVATIQLDVQLTYNKSYGNLGPHVHVDSQNWRERVHAPRRAEGPD